MKEQNDAGPGAPGNPEDVRPLIVLVQWPSNAAALLDGLREAFFPAHRNYLAAHLTLFHALPGARRTDVCARLSAETQATAPFALPFVGPISLGHGVALRVRSADLDALRARLAAAFRPWLVPQDRQPFRAHVTVQNKVAPTEARRTLDALTMAWNPSYATTATGLSLWAYAGGPWAPVRHFPFAA